MKRIMKSMDKAILLALAAFFFIFYPAVAQAEVVSFTKPLAWSADATGALPLPDISEGVYAVRDFIATEGRITGITVNWKASGKIYFEVSADNGLHYVPVVNGAPLKSGFVGGDRLRWRASTLSEGVKLYSVRIDYTDTSGVSGGFGEPRLSGFKYRKEINIKNTSDEDLYDYQLKIEGEKGNTLPGTIVRFTAADGTTLLPYYKEGQRPIIQGQLPVEKMGAVPIFWVRVPHIPKEGVSIYLYYGNDEAESLSDPEAVFDFYEGFTGESLDMDKWVLHTGQRGSVMLDKGTARLDAAELITKEFKFKEGIIEYSLIPETGFEASLNIRNKNEESYESPLWLVYNSIYKGAEHCIAISGIVKANDSAATLPLAGEEHNYRVTLDKGRITFDRLSEGEEPAQASVSYEIDPAPDAGYLSLRSGGDGGGKNIIRFGSLRCRKAVGSLPVYNIGKEERVNLPIFVNTDISASGNIVLKAGASAGYYLCADIPVSGDPARIIVPSWEPVDRAGVSASVSADKGSTYKTGCENAKFYYASKKDFSAGSTLKVRFDLLRAGIVPKERGQEKMGAVPILSGFTLDYRPGKISIISPNGGERLEAGGQARVSWSAMEYEEDYPINIEYSLDRGRTYAQVSSGAKNSGQYRWNIPESLQSRRALVRVSDGYDISVFAISRRVFTILAASLGIKGLDETQAAETEKPGLAIEPKKRPLPGEYDLLIKIGDNPSAAGYKDGDIVMVKPAGYLWGADEKANFLVVRAKLSSRQARDLMQPERKTSGKGLISKKRKFRLDLGERFTQEQRELALRGELNLEPLEVAEIEAVTEEKR
jgi:hypothetical protein